MTERGGGNQFWRFSLAVYSRPGVSEVCLALQEEEEVDVNILLFLLWRATAGVALDAGAVDALEERVGPWRRGVIQPLRAARRQIKEPPEAFAGKACRALRDGIKAVEFDAEALQQEVMFASADLGGSYAGGTLADCARASIEAYRPGLGTRQGTFVSALLAEAELVAGAAPGAC